MSASSVQVAVRVRPLLPHESGSTRCVEVLPGASVPSHLVVEEEDESDSEDVETEHGPLSSSDAPSQSVGAPQSAGQSTRPRRRTSTVRQRHQVVKIGGENGPTFTFDHVLPSDSSQREAYDTCVSPLVRSCLEGYNATVLAYGQTGSGKTHTILGPASSSSVDEEDEPQDSNGKSMESQAGVIPRALRDLFSRLNKRKLSKRFRASDMSKPEEENKPPPQDQQPSTRQSFEYEVRVQFLELYGEEVRDLLSSSTEAAPRKGSSGNGGLAIRDGAAGVEPEVIGATETTVESANDALLCLTRGMLRRVTGSTAMNAESSRSHAIMTVVVEQTTTTYDGANGLDEEQQIEVEMKRSKFHFVDLAGSERQKRSLAEGKRLKEGIDINKGLLVLGNVISALGDPKRRGKSFVPYRDSKLTRLLKGSLGGNHKTLMIACVSPASSNLEESLNCLRYANRAKNIQNNAVVNVDAESRLLSELRAQVKSLAGELLKVRETGSVDQQTSFPTPTLRSLAAGGDAKSDSAMVVSGARSDLHSIVGPAVGAVSDELKRTQQMLEEAKKEIQNRDHEVYTLKAEREYYRLQLQGGSCDSEPLMVDENGEGKIELTSFVSRVAEYERELTALREALREAELRVGDSKQGQSAVDRASAELEREKEQLIALQRALKGKKDNASDGESPSPTASKSNEGFDDEYAAEQAEVKKVTDRFAPDFDLEAEEFAEQEARDEKNFNDDEQIDSHLTDLSKSIASKEQLIHQLQVSQEKYETMRDFYEDKLRNMESQVRLREEEREQLIQELKKQEQDSHRFIELQTALEAKEQHLIDLRERQQEVLGLSKISSENEVAITRLQTDVHRMKQQKSDLQRQMVHERKVHLKEVKELKKQNMQQDKETNRWKKESDRVKMEAENAQRVAKQRLEEVGKLRSKYKEAEKKLRMQTLKRGVMERAGLDAVMVGRREVRAMSVDGVTENGSSSRRKNPKEIDVEKMRAFLDEKVADVSRKEAAADKLAQEWEDHMDLLARKEELMSETENTEDDDALRDDVEAVEVQIQYKEDRIRQLGRKLGDKPFRSTKSGGSSGPNQILEDRRFKQVCGGATPLSSAQAASRVLFGMVVRERRRVTSLARAAALLDQKAMEASDLAKSRDEALRTHLDDFRRERATIAQSSQRHILSLMNMVQSDEQSRASVASKEEEKEAKPIEDDHVAELNRGTSGDSMVLILANERIAALEKQLAEFQGAMHASEVYKAKDAETSMVLEKKCSECKLLGHEITVLRTALRQIRENLSMADISAKADSEDQDSSGPEAEAGEASAPESNGGALQAARENDVEAIMQIIADALHAESSKRQEGSCNDGCQEAFNYTDSPGKKKIMKSHVAFLQSSDSEEEGEEPEWAGDIMADLALIAEGRLPPTLKASKVRPAPKRNQETTRALNQLGKSRAQPSGTVRSRGSLKSSNGTSSNSTGANVFERLTDPDNFTGIQKHSFTSGVAKGGKANAERAAASKAATEAGKNPSPRLVAEQRKKAVNSPRKGRADASKSGGEGSKTEVSEKRTSSERLHNPSKKQNDVKGGEGGVKSAKNGSQGDKREWVAEYTSRDVFERLQKTNTQSYAGKQNNLSLEESDAKRSQST